MLTFQSGRKYSFLIPDSAKYQFCVTAAKYNMCPDKYPSTYGDCEILGKHLCITIPGDDPAINAIAALAL